MVFALIEPRGTYPRFTVRVASRSAPARTGYQLADLLRTRGHLAGNADDITPPSAALNRDVFAESARDVPPGCRRSGSFRGLRDVPGSRLYCGVVQPHVTVTFSITTGDFPLFSNSNSCDTAPSASRIVPKFHTCCGNSNTEFWAGSIPVHKQPSNINPIFQLFIGSDDRCAKLSISREIRNSGA